MNIDSSKDPRAGFAHLHVHSVYSLGEGLSGPAEICAFARLSGYESIALTDLQSTFGFLELRREAARVGIKPIYGAVIKHRPLKRGDMTACDLTLLARNRRGFRNLCLLVSSSRRETGAGRALSMEEIAAHGEGLLVMSGARGSEPERHLAGGNVDAAEKSLLAMHGFFEENFFVEIQVDDPNHIKDCAEPLRDMAARLELEPVLTADVRYVGGEREGIKEALSEVEFFGGDEGLFERRNMQDSGAMKPASEMASYRDRFRRAYDNACRISESIEGDILSEILEDPGNDPYGLLRTGEEPDKVLTEKVSRRLRLFFYDRGREERARIERLLDGELERIASSGMAGSFLLFHEVLSRVRNEKVHMGPATGLGLQSLCAYLLGITAFDPYAMDRAFKPTFSAEKERGRVLEIQLPAEDRGVVVSCLESLFNPKRVAYVPAVERLTPIRAFRIAAKSIAMDEHRLSEVIHAAMEFPGLEIKKLVVESKALARLFKKSAEVRELVKKAALLEGLPTGFTKSRRSVIVCPQPVREVFSTLEDGSGREAFIQASSDSLPAGNMIKIDLTPLSSFSVCMRTERELRKRGHRVFGWDDLPSDDEMTWRDIQSGESTGVFMMESAGVKKLCVSFSPQTMEDLTDFVTLIRSQSGERSLAERLEVYKTYTPPECDYKPELSAVLGRMRGGILYEEQLRDIISVLTGTSPEEAHRMLIDFRKDDPGVLSTVRKSFMRYAANEDVPFEEANRWFEKILRYCNRTLSKQRMLADALLVYKMFFLKAHYPSQFFLALLNTYWDNEAKTRAYLAYLMDRGLILPVDINRSELHFTLEDGKIRLGFQIIEGVSYPGLLKILNVRTRTRRFKSLEDFLRKMKGSGLTLDEVGRLIMAGAFDFTGISRTNLINALPELFEDPGGFTTKRLKDQMELPLEASTRRRIVPSGGELMETLLAEKRPGGGESAGHYRVLSNLEEFYSVRTAALVEIAGQVSNIQRLRTSSGKILGFFVLFDFSAFVHVFVPWDKFSLFQHTLEEGRKVVVRGRVGVRDEKKVCEAVDIKALGEVVTPGETKNTDEPAGENT